MSALAKLGTALPGKEEINGLDATVADLLEEPGTLRAAVIIYDVAKITTDARHLDKDPVPTIEIRQFEPIGIEKELPPAIREAVMRAREARTGMTPLPLDIFKVDEGDE